ncbi:hypothetical protein IH574_00205 [Candidatus Bathyarchaeota archaeon]|nr:hypothetical protein [Candidatus Bathyarchaeota archaeon]
MGFLVFLFSGRLSLCMDFFPRFRFFASKASSAALIGALNSCPQKTQVYSPPGLTSEYTGFSFPHPGLLHFK